MSKKKRQLSNLEFLIQGEVLQEGTTLEDAICILTDPMNCVECIAVDQCAERYGQDAMSNPDHDCLEVVGAFLMQDHKEGS